MNIHCESLDVWCYESINRHSFRNIKHIDYRSRTEADLINLKNQKVIENIQKNKIYIINDVSLYESPLRCFRSYRFCFK